MMLNPKTINVAVVTEDHEWPSKPWIGKLSDYFDKHQGTQWACVAETLKALESKGWSYCFVQPNSGKGEMVMIFWMRDPVNVISPDPVRKHRPDSFA